MQKPLPSFNVSTNCIYYSISDGGKQSFRCLDLLTLKCSK
jgi:hypothetical protein